MTKYYIVAHNYVGPNQNDDQYFDIDDIKICTKPATTNMSGEIRTEGWCGTTDDWSVHAHGEYDSLDAARDAIVKMFGVVRRVDTDLTDIGTDWYYESVGMVEAYKEGEFAYCTVDKTHELIYESVVNDIDEHTSDDVIDVLVKEYTEDLNENGYAPHASLRDILIDYRDKCVKG